jgi:protein TonB
MAPLTKESLEVSTSVGELAGSGATTQPKQASGHLRSDAVSLEISVKVHGSRVTEVVREVTPHTEPFEEQTSTMIVFPQGAVLRMSTPVSAGQMLVVTNSKSRQDAICRVVKVRTFSNAQGYVEIEFSHPQPGYWGLTFSSDAPASPNKPASAPPPTIQREEPKIEQTSDISWAPARVASPPVSKSPVTIAPSKAEPTPFVPPPPPPVRPGMPESSFISIGSQEVTQPAASSTSRTSSLPAAAPRVEPEREVRAPEPPKRSAVIDFPAAPPAAPVPSLSMAELLGDEVAVAAHPSGASSPRESTTDEGSSSARIESSPKSSHSTFGSLSGGATLGSGHSQHSELFGAGLDASIAGLPGTDAAPRQKNWLLIAACIFVLFAGVIGGVFYFRQQLGLQKTGQRAAVPATTAAAQNSSNDANRSSLAQPLAAQGNQPASNLNPAPPTVTVPGTTITVSAGATPSGTSSASVPSEPPVTPKQKAPSVTSDMLAATLNAHPVSSSHADAAQADAAPSIDAGAASPNPDAPLSEVPSSADVASPPPPVVVPEVPVKIGGDVKEPRLLTHPQPVYPAVAKQGRIQGDVLVSTQIDKAGNVVHMNVISGPPMLRQAALEALRRWKYAPSTLNGQPQSVEMQVTIKFRL